MKRMCTIEGGGTDIKVEMTLRSDSSNARNEVMLVMKFWASKNYLHDSFSRNFLHIISTNLMITSL